MKHNETHAAVSKISLPVDRIRDNINNEGSVNPDTRQLTPSTASQSRGKHFAHDPAYAGNNYTQLIRSFWFSFSFFLVRACVRARWYNLEKYATVTTLVRERTSPAVITIQNIPSRCRADDRALNSSYYTNSLCHGQPNTTKTCLLIHIYSSQKNVLQDRDHSCDNQSIRPQLGDKLQLPIFHFGRLCGFDGITETGVEVQSSRDVVPKQGLNDRGLNRTSANRLTLKVLPRAAARSRRLTSQWTSRQPIRVTSI